MEGSVKKERPAEWIVWLVQGICFSLLLVLILTAYRYSGEDYSGQAEVSAEFARLMGLFRPFGRLLLGGMAVSAAVLAVMREKKDKGVDLWYTELVLLGIILGGFILYWGNEQLKYGFLARSFTDLISGLGLMSLVYFPLLMTLLSLVQRLKNQTFLKESLALKFIYSVREGFRSRNDRLKSGTQVLSQAAFLAVDGLLALLAGAWIADGRERLGGLLLAVLLILNAWRITDSAQRGKQILAVFERIAALGNGDVGHSLDTASFHGEVKRMAETVNALDHSLERAVSERTRSERMKTELIANVSHDLRTPLTSIINYVDLLKREKIDNPRVQEYLEVLDSKAQRMKILAESLMEASKASSGNLKITWERIDMVQMLRQVIGEFQEQMEEKQLHPVLRLVDPPVVILADGKILWRVLDNLYTNTCKYAKPGTQVLIELQETAHSLVYTMKNVSAVPLHYSSEELMERFIRGEDSRTTEGSGLGLSIARSMTEQLQGKFELYSDEEMFRVRLIFPLAEE